MTSNQQKSQIINKREPISAKFKDILGFHSNSKYFSPILQILNDSGNIWLSKGNLSPILHKTSFLGG